jgi:alpha-galactosidase
MTCIVILQGPLLVGCDVRNMTSEMMKILRKKEVIQVNQGIIVILFRK